ncbi:MMPL family transporter [Actinocorallia longicatena]|uniref:MMPL family transporter n=1 Tax=Actinocorallia longicatena TaxID=111803 RepID=A0ABP6QKP6_9ACTN
MKLARVPTGRWAKWIVLVVWIALFMGLGGLGGKLTEVQKNEATEWLPTSAESTRVFKDSENFVDTDSIPTLVVYHRDGQPVTAADQAKAEADAAKFQGITSVGKVAPVVRSQDGLALMVVADFVLGDKGWDALGPAIKDFRAIAHNGGPPGLKAHVTGPGGYSGDFGLVFGGFDTTLLYITAAIVIVILLLTYRSPILWILPLLCVGVALAVAEGIVYLLAKNDVLTVNGQSSFILIVLVFGAATDYALLLIARYREELRRHEDRHEAMAVALHRAGPAIIASGATVSLAMMCLLLAELASTRSLGPVMAVGVVFGLLAMVTLLPALLVICGRWLFWPVKPHAGSDEPAERGFWSRVGMVVARRPRAVWTGTAVALGLLSVALFGLDTGGLQNHDAFRDKPDSAIGEEVQNKHFPAGSGNPIQITGRDTAGPRIQALLAATPGVLDVKPPVTKNGIAYVEGTLSHPADSDAAFALVKDLRTRVDSIEGGDVRVGGSSAVVLDITDASRHDTNLVVPVVLLVVLLILGALLRSVVAPILLVVTVILSFGAALGFSALMFEHVFGFEGADPSYPLWVFVFLVALGVDYNIFLMTRVHEEAARHGTRRGALIGLAATGGVITSAGAVLAGTFGALGSLPLVFITEMGFAVAFGVLLDTFIVRSVLVTALNLDIGGRMWWPSRLAGEPDVPLAELRDELPERVS